MGIMLTNIGLMLEDCDFLSLYANSPNIPLALHNLQKLDVRFLTHKPLNLNLQEESSSSCFEYALELADIIQKMAYPENDYELIDAIYEFAGITNKILNSCIL